MAKIDKLPKREVKEEEGELIVSRTVLKQSTEERKKIKIRPFVTDTMKISIKFGATVPTVQYGGVRVDVMITMPCYVEEFLAVYKELRDTVDKLVDKEVDRLTGGTDGEKA
jgi:hypothetical protein